MSSRNFWFLVPISGGANARFADAHVYHCWHEFNVVYGESSRHTKLADNLLKLERHTG